MVSKERLEIALTAMEDRARGVLRNVRGVGTILIQPPKGRPGAHFFFLDSIVRQPDRENRGEGDLGTNYFGVAMSKVAFMLHMHTDSGAIAAVKFGEVAFRGGLFLALPDGTYVYFAFSGGSEDEDVEIAKAGKGVFIPCMQCK